MAKTKKTSGANRKETAEQKKARAAVIVEKLRAKYPHPKSALNWASPLELLMATILSAQTTDVGVNLATVKLFKKYKSAKDYAAAKPAELEELIHSTGFFRQKAKSLMKTGQMLVDKFGGKVPDTMEALLELPGVARKTANVVLGTAYGMNEGVVVDTHVGRLAWRLGLTWTARNTKDPVRIEQDLMQMIPRKHWTFFAHALVLHGRAVCIARKPRCGECKLVPHCPSAFTFDNLPDEPANENDAAD